MNRCGVAVRVGSEFLYDGERTQVVEITIAGTVVEVVTLDVRQQTIRRFTLNELMMSDRVEMIAEAPGPAADDLEDVASVVLEAVDEPARIKAVERAADIREVLTGYRSGSGETALPGEPRAPYRPDTPKMLRYAAKCNEIGCALSTLRAQVKKYTEHGTAGLVSQRDVRPGIGSHTDPRFKEIACEVMAEHVTESKPSKSRVLLATKARMTARYGPVKMPCDSTGYEILNDLESGLPLFDHSTKRNRDIADRPKEVYGKLRPTRPGEYLLMDTTRSDVFAMDPNTSSWVNCEITVAMDWFTRLIVGVRVTPISTKSIDAACALYQAIRPPAAGPDWPANAVWPPVGIPRHVMVELEALDPKSACAVSPAMAPETLVLDHGSIFVSEHLTSVCQRLGISIQPAHLRMGRDKGPVERFFLTLRLGLLQNMPGYKGFDLNSRGLAPERDAWYYVDELEARIREWIAVFYHNEPHKGLRGMGKLSKLQVTPAEKWAQGIARGGYLELPRDPYLALEFLPVVWRTIQPQGIRWENRFYQHHILAGRVGSKSPYLEKDGKWPIHYNPDDIRKVYMRHPDSREWFGLTWCDAVELAFPFSQDAMKFERVLARAEDRYINGPMAITDFLERRNLALGNTIAERRILLRMEREQSTLIGDIEAAMSQEEEFDDDQEGRAITAHPDSAQDLDYQVVDELDEDQPDSDDFIDEDINYDDYYSDTLDVV